jgi:SET domain-containing protein
MFKRVPFFYYKRLSPTNMAFNEDKVRSAKSAIDGMGCFAIAPIKARVKIGNMTGELITTREARRRVKLTKRIKMVEFNEKWSLDASFSNDLSNINHSCSPNTYIRLINTTVEFYALRAIKKGEELSADYGETQHDKKLKCGCGAPNCRGWL